MGMHYDLTDLTIFLAVADEGNLSRGARRCHLAPSSVSLRIKGLEVAVGTPLFIRHARGVTLTPAGHVMSGHVRRCLAQLEQMHTDLLPFSQNVVGHITLFANTNAINSYLPEDLAHFFARYPTVRITLEEHTSHDIGAAVAAKRADIGIVAVENDEHPGLDFLPYREDELVLLVPKDSAFGGQSAIRFADCMSQPFISLQSGTALHTFLVNHAAALGGRLDVRVQVAGYRAIARLVASGAGIGIVPRSAVEPTDASQLAAVELLESWARRDLRVCVRRQRRDGNPFLQALVDILCSNSSAAHVLP